MHLPDKNTAFIMILVLIALSFHESAAQTLPGRYHRYAEMQSIFESIQNDHPDIVKFDTMGFSTRFRIPMLRLKISSAAHIEQDKPVALIAGGVHANEVLGPEVVLGFIQDIIGNYDSGNERAINLINSLEIYCVPFINPEGHIYVEGNHVGWRKNQCDNDSNGVFDFHDGVDNNRNYDIGWELANTPNAITPESSMYRGTAPFTQSENMAMRDFGLRFHPIVAIDYHSPFYGLSEVVYYPWFWRTSDGGHGASPDEAMMSSIGNQFAASIINDAGDSTYRSRRAVVSEGDFLAYYYGYFGTAAFTVELSDTTIQRASLVDSIVTRNLPSIYFLLERALRGRITGVVRDSVTLEPLDAEVRVLECHNDDIRPRLCRADFGRYDRILNPGSYSLRFTKNEYLTQYIYNVIVDSLPVTNDILLVPLAPRPPAPVLIFPSDGQIMNNNQFAFDWSDVDLATTYLIEISIDSTFQNPIIYDSTLTNSTYELLSPPSVGTYHWRVKGGNGNGWGPYALAQRFTIEAQSIENPQRAIQFTLQQNYPNPFNTQTGITYSLTEPCNVSIDIFDILGRRIETLIDEMKPAGNHRVLWNASDRISGIYFYRIRVGDRIETKKMVLMK